jgi:general secretion pathway protein M
MRYQLNPREKLIISLGLAALVVTLLLYGGFFPLMDRRAISERQAQSRENELQEMIAFQNQYETLQRENSRMAALLARRPKDFSLFSFLDQLAGATGIKQNIVYMKPSSLQDENSQYRLSRVEIKIDQVTLDQVSRFLYRIETSPHLIQVPRLSIKQNQQDGGLLETVLQVETLET